MSLSNSMHQQHHIIYIAKRVSDDTYSIGFCYCLNNKLRELRMYFGTVEIVFSAKASRSKCQSIVNYIREQIGRGWVPAHHLLTPNTLRELL